MRRLSILQSRWCQWYQIFNSLALLGQGSRKTSESSSGALGTEFSASRMDAQDALRWFSPTGMPTSNGSQLGRELIARLRQAVYLISVKGSMPQHRVSGYLLGDISSIARFHTKNLEHWKNADLECLRRWSAVHGGDRAVLPGWWPHYPTNEPLKKSVPQFFSKLFRTFPSSTARAVKKGFVEPQVRFPSANRRVIPLDSSSHINALDDPISRIGEHLS